jgi:hypothetical protein
MEHKKLWMRWRRITFNNNSSYTKLYKKNFIMNRLFILESLLHLLTTSQNTYFIIRCLLFLEKILLSYFLDLLNPHDRHTRCAIARVRRATAPFFLVCSQIQHNP